MLTHFAFTAKRKRVELEMGDRKVLEPFSDVLEGWESLRENNILPDIACCDVDCTDFLMTTLARINLLLDVLPYLPPDVKFGKRQFLSSCLSYVYCLFIYQSPRLFPHKTTDFICCVLAKPCFTCSLLWWVILQYLLLLFSFTVSLVIKKFYKVWGMSSNSSDWGGLDLGGFRLRRAASHFPDRYALNIYLLPSCCVLCYLY